MTIKHDNNKHRPTLILKSMARAINKVIAVGEHGAKKYADDNWLTVPNAVDRYTNAMLRHQMAEFMGEARDEDSGFLHAAHVAWNALARLDLMMREMEKENIVERRPVANHIPAIDDSDEPWPSDRPHSFGPHARTAESYDSVESLHKKIKDEAARLRSLMPHTFPSCAAELNAKAEKLEKQAEVMWGRAYGDAYALTPEEVSELVGRIATRLRRP